MADSSRMHGVIPAVVLVVAAVALAVVGVAGVRGVLCVLCVLLGVGWVLLAACGVARWKGRSRALAVVAGRALRRRAGPTIARWAWGIGWIPAPDALAGYEELAVEPARCRRAIGWLSWVYSGRVPPGEFVSMGIQTITMRCAAVPAEIRLEMQEERWYWRQGETTATDKMWVVDVHALARALYVGVA